MSTAAHSFDRRGFGGETHTLTIDPKEYAQVIRLQQLRTQIASATPLPVPDKAACPQTATIEPSDAPHAAAAEEARKLIDKISREPRLPRAVDAVYDSLDDLLLGSSFSAAAVFLSAITQNLLPLAVRLSALTVATPWRNRLALELDQLKEKIREQAFADGGEEKVRAVFRGIR